MFFTQTLLEKQRSESTNLALRQTEPKSGEDTFAPRIIEKVTSQSAPDGCAAEFVCKVEGNPRPQITWFRQTAIIKPSQDFQVGIHQTSQGHQCSINNEYT